MGGRVNPRAWGSSCQTKMAGSCGDLPCGWKAASGDGGQKHPRVSQKSRTQALFSILSLITPASEEVEEVRPQAGAGCKEL